MSFSYANPTSDPSAGGIGWFNFGSRFVITPDMPVLSGQNLTSTHSITLTVNNIVNS